jgi:hypothetical protein
MLAWRASSWLAVAVVALGCTLVMSAGPKRPPRPPQQQQQTPDTTLVTELELAKSVLEQAKHDYDGHRASSIADLQKAIDMLSHHDQGKDDKKGKKDEKSTTEEKPQAKEKPKQAQPGQAKSDNLLRDAHNRLSAIHRQMTTGKASDLHKKAAAEVDNAMSEIDAALKVK